MAKQVRSIIVHCLPTAPSIYSGSENLFLAPSSEHAAGYLVQTTIVFSSLERQYGSRDGVMHVGR